MFQVKRKRSLDTLPLGLGSRKKLCIAQEIQTLSGEHIIAIILNEGYVIQTEDGTLRRRVILCDNSTRTIDLILWMDQAYDFDFNKGDIISITKAQAKKSKFKHQLHVTTETQIELDMVSERGRELNTWWKANHTLTTFTPLYVTTPLETVVNFMDEPREGQHIFIIKAYLKNANERISYPSCTTEKCNMKTYQLDDGTWQCGKCRKSLKKPNHKYLLNITVGDGYGSFEMRALDSIGINLFNKNAGELLKLKVCFLYFLIGLFCFC